MGEKARGADSSPDARLDAIRSRRAGIIGALLARSAGFGLEVSGNTRITVTAKPPATTDAVSHPTGRDDHNTAQAKELAAKVLSKITFEQREEFMGDLTTQRFEAAGDNAAVAEAVVVLPEIVEE